MCLDCQIRLRETLSWKSKLRIDNYIQQQVDFEKRRLSLLDRNAAEPGPWLSKCIINGSDVSEQTEYQIYCQCDGKRTIYAYMPFMISGSAMD
jgi:hypothetical protein